MPAASVPNTFTTGTQVLATPWNENFAALVTWLNTYAIQKDGSVAFTALPSIPTTTPTLDAHLSSRKYMNDSIRGKSDRWVTATVTPGGNTDTNTSGSTTDWITLIASQLVPVWAVTCLADIVVSGHFAPTVTATTLINASVGTVQFGSVYFSHTVSNARNTTAVRASATVSGVANTTVAVKLRATGTGNAVRIDGSSRIDVVLRFFA